MRILAEAVAPTIRSQAAKLQAVRSPEYAQAASVIAALAARFPMRAAVMFSSASAGEGTTAAVLGVAAELSATYRSRVLVVEFNFSRPTFTSRFSLDEERTLTLPGEGSPLDVVSPVAPNVSVIAAGHGAPGPIADMVAQISRVLNESTGKYDVILIDTPPLLERSDALALASVVSKMVLVVEAGKTSSKDLERVRESVSQAGIGIVGAVLNKEKKIMPRWLRRWLG